MRMLANGVRGEERREARERGEWRDGRMLMQIPRPRLANCEIAATRSPKIVPANEVIGR